MSSKCYLSSVCDFGETEACHFNLSHHPYDGICNCGAPFSSAYIITNKCVYDLIQLFTPRVYRVKRGYYRTLFRKRQLFHINKFISLGIMYWKPGRWFFLNILHRYKMFKFIFLKIFRKQKCPFIAPTKKSGAIFGQPNFEKWLKKSFWVASTYWFIYILNFFFPIFIHFSFKNC